MGTCGGVASATGKLVGQLRITLFAGIVTPLRVGRREILSKFVYRREAHPNLK
jgi:hypothetical protein